MPMSKYANKEVLPGNLLDHRAVKAWRRIKPECFEPQNIEVLKLKTRKSAVYRLTGAGSNGSAIIAKRCQAATASVERVVYEEFLPGLPLPALRCHGFVEEPGGEFCWLFLEDAGGQEYSPASAAHRALAGQWLASVHRAPFATGLQARLPDRGPAHYLQLLRSSRAALLEYAGNPVLSADEVALVRRFAACGDAIEAHWDEVEKSCGKLPRTLVHGDFVIKNLRVHAGATTGPALLVFDWEMAGWGVPATDLAQFVGRCASPELKVYCPAVRHDFPQLDLRDIQRLADYGNVLRMVDKVFWATVSMEGSSYEFLVNPLSHLRSYEPEMVAALRAVNWRCA